MNKIKHLIKSITHGKPLSVRFMMSIMDDSLLPNNIKKKVILYYKGDKRLSHKKFVEELKHVQVSQPKRGGSPPSPQSDRTGWRFVAVNNQYIGVPKNTTPDTPPDSPNNIFAFGAYHSESQSSLSSRQGSPSPKFIELQDTKTSHIIKIDTATPLGKGNFAAVFAINNEHVCKLFFSAPQSVFAGIETNILSLPKELFKTTFKIFGNDVPVFYNINTSSLPLSHDDRTFSNFGYRMIRCNQTLNDLLSESFDILKNNILTLKEMLTEKNFVHGDIKLDNIMIGESPPGEPIISDWDGVYVWNDSLMPPPPANTCFSPATAHPYFVWFNTLFKKTNPSFEEIFTKTTLKPDAPWSFMLGTSPVADAIRAKFYSLYDRNNPANPDNPDKNAFNKYVNDNKTDIEWHKYMLQRCDQYSLGMSLYLCLLHKGMEGSVLLTLANSILKESCTMYTSGGKEPDTRQSTTHMSLESIHEKRTPQNIFNNNPDLANLMTSRMFLSYEQVQEFTPPPFTEISFKEMNEMSENLKKPMFK
jgi:hypothetical protein